MKEGDEQDKKNDESEIVVNKNKRFRKEKPWDNDPDLDKWKIEKFTPEDNPNGMVDESSFSCLFP